MTVSLRTSLNNGLNSGLRESVSGGAAGLGTFKAASLDLLFGKKKTLKDRITGKNLITFSRASSATFVDSDGLIKTTPVNLARNSEDFSTGRNNASYGVLSTVNVNQIKAPNGTNTADEIVTVATAQQNRVANPHSVTSGKYYTYSVFIKYNNTDTVQFYLGYTNKINGTGTFVFSTETATVSGATGLSAGFDKLSNGWYRFYFTASAFTTGNTDSGFIGGTAAGEKVYVWGEQIEEGLTPTDYIPTTSTISGAARFDHDPVTGESLGLLIEEARTNLVTYSEQLDQWVIGSNSTVTANAATAPDGTNTADRVEFPPQSGTFISSNTFMQSGTTYTASVYVKAVTPGTNHKFTLSFGGQGSPNATSRLTATGEWQRFTATITPTLSSGNKPFIINNEGDGFRSDIYVWGVQVEEASSATSYIPTTSSQVTRAADFVEIDGFISLVTQNSDQLITQSGDSLTGVGLGFGDFYNSSEGTMFVDAGTSTNTGSFDIFEYSNGTVSVRHTVRYDAGNTRVSFTGSVPVSQQHVNLSSPASIKAAATQSLGFAVNGVLTGNAGTSNSGTKTQLAIGYRASTGGQFINGHIKRLSYFPTGLTDATLQSITS